MTAKPEPIRLINEYKPHILIMSEVNITDRIDIRETKMFYNWFRTFIQGFYRVLKKIKSAEDEMDRKSDRQKFFLSIRFYVDPIFFRSDPCLKSLQIAFNHHTL